MDTSDSKITFNDNGQCEYCENYYNNIIPHWHPDETGLKEITAVMEIIKREGKNKAHDCIIGLSGGV
jgi:hypothetical protein